MKKPAVISAIMAVILFASCRKEHLYTDSASLGFSADTVMFDTIFTNLATANKVLMVYNPYPKTVRISSIRLSGGSSSFYWINVNGRSGNDFADVEIFPKDSMFIFVAAKLDQVGQDKPLIVKDSLIFTTNGNQQKVMLVSYGQDVVVLKNNHLSTQSWTANKPYLVFGTVTVDTGQTLTMEAGTRVYMYNNANIKVNGTLVISGTTDNRVLIQHTRPEKFYYNKAGQWGKIILTGSSNSNVIENADIFSPVTGIEIGDTLGSSKPDLLIRNSTIVNSKLCNIKAYGASITAENCVFAHAGLGCVVLYKGGKYKFFHCSLINQGSTLAGYYMNALAYKDEYAPGISGTLDSIVAVNTLINDGSNYWITIESSNKNYFFKNCFVKADPNKFNLSEHSNFDSIYYTITAGRSLFENSFVKDEAVEDQEYDFAPDSLSDLRNKASMQYALQYPSDMKGNTRVSGVVPDIGALQWQPSKK